MAFFFSYFSNNLIGSYFEMCKGNNKTFFWDAHLELSTEKVNIPS